MGNDDLDMSGSLAKILAGNFSSPVNSSNSFQPISQDDFMDNLLNSSKSYDFVGSNIKTGAGTGVGDDTLFGMSSGQLSGLGSIAGGVAGLASALSQMPVLRAQRRGLEQNIKFAKQDQENRYNKMKSFNSFGQNA